MAQFVMDAARGYLPPDLCKAVAKGDLQRVRCMVLSGQVRAGAAAGAGDAVAPLTLWQTAVDRGHVEVALFLTPFVPVEQLRWLRFRARNGLRAGKHVWTVLRSALHHAPTLDAQEDLLAGWAHAAAFSNCWDTVVWCLSQITSMALQEAVALQVLSTGCWSTDWWESSELETLLCVWRWATDLPQFGGRALVQVARRMRDSTVSLYVAKLFSSPSRGREAVKEVLLTCHNHVGTEQRERVTEKLWAAALGVGDALTLEESGFSPELPAWAPTLWRRVHGWSESREAWISAVLF